MQRQTTRSVSLVLDRMPSMSKPGRAAIRSSSDNDRGSVSTSIWCRVNTSVAEGWMFSSSSALVTGSG